MPHFFVSIFSPFVVVGKISDFFTDQFGRMMRLLPAVPGGPRLCDDPIPSTNGLKTKRVQFAEWGIIMFGCVTHLQNSHCRSMLNAKVLFYDQRSVICFVCLTRAFYFVIVTI